MATSAKKKAAQREKESRQETLIPKTSEEKRCTCLVAIRGRGEHAIDCPLY